MEIIVHRINTVSALGEIPEKYGCEIDIRADGSKLILNHDPFRGGTDFYQYLDSYHHGTLVLNIKEAGIESEVLKAVEERVIPSYFLLDVEFPYLYKASRLGVRAIAVRFSEDEPLELVKRYRQKVDWVWIDTNTYLPLDATSVSVLKMMKSCLVCPERWGRPEDILTYRLQMNKLGFEPTAVMTTLEYVKYWQQDLC